MAQYSHGTYIPSRPPYVLHVVGPKGAGKHAFMQTYFPAVPAFDLSARFPAFHAQYSEDLIMTLDFADSDPGYREFDAQLHAQWNGFLESHDPVTLNPADRTSAFVVAVISSGLNSPLNALLVWYFPTVLLVVKDGADLAVQKPTLHHTRVFDRSTGSFSGVLDAHFIRVSPPLAQAQKKGQYEPHS